MCRMDDPRTPRRSRRWLTAGLAVIGLSFLALGVLVRVSWPGPLGGALWPAVGAAFLVGWSSVGAALRPRRSAVLGAAVSLGAYVVVGLTVAVAITLWAGAALDPAIFWVALVWPMIVVLALGPGPI